MSSLWLIVKCRIFNYIRMAREEGTFRIGVLGNTKPYFLGLFFGNHCLCIENQNSGTTNYFSGNVWGIWGGLDLTVLFREVFVDIFSGVWSSFALNFQFGLREAWMFVRDISLRWFGATCGPYAVDRWRLPQSPDLIGCFGYRISQNDDHCCHWKAQKNPGKGSLAQVAPRDIVYCFYGNASWKARQPAPSTTSTPPEPK